MRPTLLSKSAHPIKYVIKTEMMPKMAEIALRDTSLLPKKLIQKWRARK